MRSWLEQLTIDSPNLGLLQAGVGGGVEGGSVGRPEVMGPGVERGESQTSV